MALIKCPDCGKDVSDLAPACIGCGRPMEILHNRQEPPSDTTRKKELLVDPTTIQKKDPQSEPLVIKHFATSEQKKTRKKELLVDPTIIQKKDPQSEPLVIRHFAISEQKKNTFPKPISWKSILWAVFITFILLGVYIGITGDKKAHNYAWMIAWLILTIEGWKYWKWKSLIPSCAIIFFSLFVSAMFWLSGDDKWDVANTMILINIIGVIIFAIIYYRRFKEECRNSTSVTNEVTTPSVSGLDGLEVRLKPDDAKAHTNLGAAYGNLGRYQEATEAFKRAIRLKSDDVDAHNNLGNSYDHLGHKQEAVEAYKQAIRLKPDDANAYRNLGLNYAKFGWNQQAIDAFKQAICLKPDLAEAHYNLGVTYFEVGNKDSALEEYKILKNLNQELANDLFKFIKK